MQFDLDMKSEYKDLFLSIRKLLINDYQLQEKRKNRMTLYFDEQSGVCQMKTMSHGIDIGFLKGEYMRDELGLLNATGRLMKVLTLNELNIDNARYYLEQAIEINANK